MSPMTACFDAVYPDVPAPAWIELTDAQLTMEPRWAGRPSSLLVRRMSIAPLDPRGGRTTHTWIESCFIICLNSCLLQSQTPSVLTSMTRFHSSVLVSQVRSRGPTMPAKFLPQDQRRRVPISQCVVKRTDAA